MSFTRSNSGLSNMALFHQVDLIVFTEGGCQSYSFEKVIEGKYNDFAVDIKFWSGIFEASNFNKKVQFRGLGSKTATKKICELIVNNKIQNVVVTRDSDLDDFISTKYKSPFILYTKGYSWENDVYHKDIVTEYIKSLLFTQNLNNVYQNVLDSSYKIFQRKSKRLLKAELLFRLNGEKLITDCNGDRFINGKSFPKINNKQIINLIRQKKDKIARPATLDGIDLNCCSVTFSYGKLAESLALANISYIVSKIAKVSTQFPLHIIAAAMIDKFISEYQKAPDQYYSNLIDKLAKA